MMTKTSPQTLNVEVMRGYKAFLRLEGEWQQLFAAAARPWPYLRHSWLRLSWELTAQPLDQLLVVLVREGDLPVMGGIFVLGSRNLLPVVRALGSGLPQFDDLLWRPSVRTAEHASALLTRLRQVVWLPRTLRSTQIRSDSPLLAAAGAAGLQQVRRATRTSFAVDVSAFSDFDTYLHSRSSNLRRDHSRRLRRLGEAGKLEYGRETGSAGLAILPWLFDTKRGWLEDTQRQADWLENGYVDRFFTRLLSRSDAPPWWIATLRLDGRLIAGKLCLAERGLWVFSKSARDPAEHRHSPGRTLTLLLIETAFAEKTVETIDMGLTGEGWKGQIATVRIEVASERIRLK